MHFTFPKIPLPLASFERVVFLSLLFLPLLIGCTHTRPFDATGPEERSALNDQLEEIADRIDVRADDGRFWLDVQSVQVRPDTTLLFSSEGWAFYVATADLNTITLHVHDSRSTLVGAGAGLGIAVLFGVPATLTKRASSGMFTNLEAAALVTTAVSIITVPLGAIIGRLNGKEIVYHFEKKSPQLR